MEVYNPYGSCFWCQREGKFRFIDIDGHWRDGCAIHKERYELRTKEVTNAP